MSLDDERAAIAAQLEYIARNIMDRDEMAEVMSQAVADGIRAAVSDPKMWAAAGSAMQAQAVNATGSLVLDGLKAGVRKTLLVAVVAGGIYWVGGWAALAAAWKAITGGGHP